VNIDNSVPKSYADIVYNRLEIASVRDIVKDLEKTYVAAKEKKALEDLSSFDADIIETNIGKCIITKTSNYEVYFLKQLADRLLEKTGAGFVFIANVIGNNVNFIAEARRELTNKVDCGALIKEASTKSSGNGGGSKMFGQGGGSNISNLDQILADIKTKL
jgi:alanyl-tRNA synthetase